MHDAMQQHFSRFANQPQWALWTFFARLYEENGVVDPRTGGIMFDSLGQSHRQGTAIFVDSFIRNAPPADVNPEAWKSRMALWTAAHEMGHAFNLLHAWDKGFNPWLPQDFGYHLQTFMNYPYFYGSGPSGNQEANTIRFFREFGFRFIDQELLFMRHAPERFVIMGGEAWATNHALEQADISPAPTLRFELRVNRETALFEFMEPVVLEMKLSNISAQPQLIPYGLPLDRERLTLLVQRGVSAKGTFSPRSISSAKSSCYPAAERSNIRVLVRFQRR